MFHPESISRVILSREGLSLLRTLEVDVLQAITVAEPMAAHLPRLFGDDGPSLS